MFDPRPPKRHHPRVAVAATVALATLTAVSCTSAESSSKPVLDRVSPISIAVEQNSLGQQIMGHIYAEALTDSERTASVDVIANGADFDQIGALEGNHADMIIGCTGDLLLQANPVEAEAILEDIDSPDGTGGTDGTDGTANPNDASLDVAVFEALMLSLPSELNATDQSGAQSCEDTTVPDLPQNIIPIFGAATFDRDELGVLDTFTKRMTTQELEELIEEAERTGSVESVVAEWMGSAESEAGSNINQDSDSGQDGAEDSFGF